MARASRTRRLAVSALLAGATLLLLAASPPDDGAVPTGEDGRVRLLVELAGVEPPPLGLSAGEDEAAFDALEAAQTAAAADLDAAFADVDVVRRFGTLALLAVSAPPESVEAIEDLPSVTSVTVEEPLELLLSESVPAVGGDRVIDAGVDGRGWTVAIIDSGVERDHPTLRGRVVAEACFSSSGECPDGSTEQHGTGAAAPCTFNDRECGHGTHVAATAAGAAASTTSGSAARGMAPGADILAVQVASNAGGEIAIWPSDVKSALEWVDEQVETGRQVAAVNLSVGGGIHSVPCDAAHPNAVELTDRLDAAGVSVVAATGNEYDKTGIAYPACLGNATSVGATNRDDEITDFSNMHPGVDLLAPGTHVEDEEAIVAAWPGGTLRPSQGTSMAAPHVAGALTTLRQAQPSATPSAHRDLLKREGVPIPFGGTTIPRLDTAAAHEAIGAIGDDPEAPGPPTAVAATALGADRARVSWEPPASDGGAPILAYEVAVVGTSETSPSVSASLRSITVTGLEHGQRYRFTVRASNSDLVGWGEPSAETNVVIPKHPPPHHGFIDVPSGAYFDAPVAWLADERITAGVTHDRYGPRATITRAQMVTFLWRMMDSPTPGRRAPFFDVDHGAYYADAVAWAVEAGVTEGVDSTRFAPHAPVNRAQVATLLHRMSGESRVTGGHGFFDVPDGAFYTDAVTWAAAQNITSGTSPGRFSPLDGVSRGQMAAFLWRLAGNPRAWDPSITVPSTIVF